ncbi:flagellar biosynthesis protein FlgJ [Paracoccus liaowanqingii]|uniref:Flagellar biosynthesis protein FlgJ n=1 Tax=Paracoccus liaowanqingii TaxID=2560053 RepID=A0A4Z1BVT3_9RHOB|nr:rod-binding protein [Paracoccus liaowanqingii]TGN60518.1 flagellar biosynthesis protein FlgJ [Paracoccus liaowanqingii]
MQIDPLVPARGPKAGPHAVADQLEQAFLEEMLKYCGPSPAEGAFFGGAGEDPFASFLTREHAALLARRLDLGFAAMLGARE